MSRKTKLLFILFTGFFLVTISCKTKVRQQAANIQNYNSSMVADSVDSVPAVYTVSPQLKRVVIVRLKNGTDVLEGLREAVRKEEIKNGIILQGIGSVTSWHIHAVSETTGFPTINAYSKAKGPFDVLTIGGYIFNGRVHAHITLSDLKTTIGGHLEEGTETYTFLIITIGVLDENTNLEWFDNWRRR